MMEDPQGPDPQVPDHFVDAISQLMRRTETGHLESSAAMTEALRTIHGTLTGFLKQYRAPDIDFDELVDSVTIAILDACLSGRVDLKGNPKSYVLTLAKWRALDYLRVRSREDKYTVYIDLDTADLPQHLLVDDSLSRQFESLATAALVERALRLARASGDETAYKVAVQALNDIERSGAMPTLRELGKSLGVSHTTARKALKRFRHFLESVREP